MIKTVFIALVCSILLNSCEKKDITISSDEQNAEIFAWNSNEGVKDKNYDLTRLDIKSIVIGDKRITIDGDYGKSISFDGSKIENDRIEFIAAYPNANDPVFVLIESGSNGTCCPWSEYHLLFNKEGRLKLIDIPTTSLTEIRVTKSKVDGFTFQAKYAAGEDKSGDVKYGYFIYKEGDNVFLKQGIRDNYPGIEKINYGTELLSNKELRSKIFKLNESEIKELRSLIQMETPIQWQDGSAFILCGVPVKGEWDSTQIIAVDLEKTSFEIQRFSDGKLNFIKKIGEIRDQIRSTFSISGECFQTKYQYVSGNR